LRQNAAVRTLLTLLACLVVAAAAPAGVAGGQAPREAYDRAVALQAEGNDTAALSLLWAAAGAAPADADIQNRLGEALERIGALDAAVDAYQRALGGRPDFSRAMNNMVVALAKAGRGADAVRRAETWLAARPTDADRLFTVGLAQSEQDVEAAMRTLREVIARRPDHALAHYNLALLLKRVDRDDEAIVAARRATAIDARPEAHLALGSLHLQQGDFVRAIAALEAALAADRRNVEAWVMLGTVHRARGDLTRAADALRRAIDLRPTAWGSHAALAAVLRLAGDDAGARRASDEAERRRVADQRERAAVVMTAVGVARLDAGDAEGARERFAAAIAVAESYAPAHYHLGRALSRLGRTGEARDAFDRARRLNPSLVAPPVGR
jgi:tetratricopeptide (TPR) repeat protein